MAVKLFNDSSLWREKMENIIQRGGNMMETSLVTVSLSEFKLLDHAKKNGKASCINAFVESIVKVLPTSRCDDSIKGYSIYLSNNDIILIYEDGRIFKDDSQCSNLRELSASQTKDGHKRTRIYCDDRYTSIFLERLMCIAHAVYTNKIPSSLDGVSCNVKDSSGSVGNIFGAVFNISPENLEFCTVGQNSMAYGTAKKLYELTGKHYRISALDIGLHEAVNYRPVEDIIWYINKTGIQEVSVR